MSTSRVFFQGVYRYMCALYLTVMNCADRKSGTTMLLNFMKRSAREGSPELKTAVNLVLSMIYSKSSTAMA